MDLNRSGDMHDQLVEKPTEIFGNAGNTTNVDENSNVTTNLLEGVIVCFRDLAHNHPTLSFDCIPQLYF
jgi:hypothetical protein